MSDLKVIDATTLVELGVAEEVIAGLRGRLAGLTADTHQDYVMVKSAISEVRSYRTGVEKARKALKASALDWGRKVDAEARRVTDLLLEIETPLRKEKARIDDQAERLRKEKEEAERLASEAKERVEREAREAEEAAKREAERKEREAEMARMEEERKALKAEGKRLYAEQQRQRQAFEKERRAIEAEREDIEAKKRAVQEKAWKELEAKQAIEREARAKEERLKAAAAERVRLAEEEAEAARLAEERKPDVEKLKDFGDQIEALRINHPALKTDWANDWLEEVCALLSAAASLARIETDDEGELAAADAEKTVLEQSPPIPTR